MTSPPHYRPDIDGLRGIALIAVVLFHAGVPGFGGGFIGVDVFFVISGYLITGILVRDLDRGGVRFAHFYERRARRIVPALLPILAVASVAAWAVMTAEDFRHFGRSLGATALFASNLWYAVRSSYFLPDPSVLSLLHTWTLGVEEQFYLAFPLLLAVCWRRGRRVTLMAICLCLAASMGLAFWLAHSRPEWAFFLLPTRLWELLVGAAGALWPIARVHHRWAGWAGLGLIAAGFAAIDSDTLMPGPLLLLPVLGTVAVLAGGSETSPPARLLSARALVAVGLVSYGTYLWHLPLFAYAHYVWLGALPVPAVSALVTASLALGWASYRWIERPVRSSRMLASRRALAAACGGGLALFAIVGIAIATERLSPRDGPIERAMDGRFAGDGIAETTVPSGNAPLPFVLYGDSHARQYYRALTERMGPGALVSGDGCLSLPGLSNLDPPDPDPKECRAKIDDLTLLLKARQVHAVVLAALWDRPMWASATGTGGQLPSAGGRAAFEAALGRLVAQVPAGTRVVLVGQVPAARPRGAPGMHYGWLRCRAYLNAACPTGYPRAEAEGNSVNRVLLNFARRHPRVTFIDPAQVLCGASTCPIVDRGRLIYSDETHVARAAGGRVADRIARASCAPAPSGRALALALPCP